MVDYRTRNDDAGRHFSRPTAYTTPMILPYYVVVILQVLLIGACSQGNFGGVAFSSSSTPQLYVSSFSFSSSKSTYNRGSFKQQQHQQQQRHQIRNGVVPIPGHQRCTMASSWRHHGVSPRSFVRDDEMTNEPNHNHIHPRSGSQKAVVLADYMATCVPGMAHILADELNTLGGQQIELSGTSAVYFRVDYHQPTIILNILLWCRTAHKIMELLCRTNEPIYTRDDVYQWIRTTIPTTDLLLNPNPNVNGKQTWFTLSVAVTLNNAKYIPSDINHSHYTALNIKNALVDAAREEVVATSGSQKGSSNNNNNNFEADRPSVDTTESCDVPLIVMVRGIPSSTSSFTSSYSGNSNNYNNNRPPYNKNGYDTEEAQPPSGGAHISLFRCIHGVGSLHRRGYRSNMQIHKAAIKESTAAALLYAAQWHVKCQTDNGAVLMDPMMGSGTLLVEGAMIAADIAPGLMRIKCGIPWSQSPPILRWKLDIDNDDDDSGTKSEPIQTIWNRLLIDATTRAQRGIESLRERNIHIVGNDMNDRAYELATASFQQAGLRNVVQLDCTDCAHWTPKIVPRTAASTNADSLPWMIVSNPPWGVRLSEDMDISWEALRTFLRSDSSIVPKSNDDTNQSEVWILSGNAEATKHLGLRRSQSIPLQTGDQNLRWLQYILRSPGSMNHTKSDDQHKRILQTDNVRRFDERPYNGNRSPELKADRLPSERRENQNHISHRSTTSQFRDRQFRTDAPNRNNVSFGSGRRQLSYTSPSEQRKQGRPEQAPRQRKAKKAAPSTNTENEWLI